MSKLITIVVVLFVLIGVYEIVKLFLQSSKGNEDNVVADEKKKYQYTRRQFFLTRAEHEFYDALVIAVGSEYHIFAQVHLPTLLDNRVVGQDWRASLAHINRKSVDFVLCDKAYISPKLAIELDDKSHERPDRQERDIEVERMLKDAGVPLLRLENHGRFNPNELAQKIKDSLVI